MIEIKTCHLKSTNGSTIFGVHNFYQSCHALFNFVLWTVFNVIVKLFA